MVLEERERKQLLPLIVEKAENGGFNLSDFWKEGYEKLCGYTLAEILETCERLVEAGRIKQRDDGVYIPAV